MTLSRRDALGGLGAPWAGALVSTFGSVEPGGAAPDSDTGPPSNPVSPEQFGATGDGRTDDWPALTRCLTFAKQRGAAVRLASRSYGIRRTLVVPSGVVVTGTGCGRADEGTGSELLALVPGMLVVRVASQARLASLSIQCAGRAHTGLLVQGARVSLADVQVYAAVGHAFIFDQSQNGTFINICARGARSCFCLLNGARNNSFFNATAAAADGQRGPLPPDQTIWTLMIDVTDPWQWGTTTTVVLVGNDQNRVFGGIFEAARFGIRARNPHGYRENGALLGMTMFVGCPEFTVASLLDSSEQPDWDGTLAFPDGITFIGGDRTPMTVGKAGRLIFGGMIGMTGAHDMPWRGIGCAHNLVEHSYARQSLLGPGDVADPRATGIAASVFPASLLEGAWAKRDPISGDIDVNVSGAARDHAGILIGLGGSFAPGQPANARGRLLLRLSFAISGLADHEAIFIYVAASAPVFRRRLAPAGVALAPGAGELRNGIYQFLYRLGTDEEPAFTLARGTARTGFTLSGFEMLVA